LFSWPNIGEMFSSGRVMWPEHVRHMRILEMYTEFSTRVRRRTSEIDINIY